MNDINTWLDHVRQAATGYEFASFLVGIEEKGGRESPEGALLKRKAGAILQGEWRGTRRLDFQDPDVTFVIVPAKNRVNVQTKSLYFYGRYLKHRRDLPQTVWHCKRCRGRGCRECGGTGKTHPTSVQEIIAAPFVREALAKEGLFHGAGREDIDVRCLGAGRPFVIEIGGPKRRTFPVAPLVEEVNRSDGVRTTPLIPVRRDAVAVLKGMVPDKTYRALVELGAPHPSEDAVRATLASFRNTVIHQRTPQRVSHRRADLTRERTIHTVELLSYAPPNLEISLTAESGAYVKEFMTGDEGRTQPCLTGALGTILKPLELDVLEVKMDDSWIEKYRL